MVPPTKSPEPVKLTHIAVASAQVWLFALALSGFIGLLFVLIAGGAHLDATTEKLVYAMLGVFGTIVSQMSGYFFSRQRPDTSPPGETTVTTRPQTTIVTTAPTGGEPRVTLTTHTPSPSSNDPPGAE